MIGKALPKDDLVSHKQITFSDMKITSTNRPTVLDFYKCGNIIIVNGYILLNAQSSSGWVYSSIYVPEEYRPAYSVKFNDNTSSGYSFVGGISTEGKFGIYVNSNNQIGDAYLTFSYFSKDAVINEDT